MKTTLLLLVGLLLLIADVKAQSPDTLVIEFMAPVKNRFSVAGLLALRNKGQTDFEEDGIPEVVLFEDDAQGNTAKVIALDGRTRALKWELDLTNIINDDSNLNKLSTGFTYPHRDSMIWRGFRRIRRLGGLGKSTGADLRLAVMSGQNGGVLAINPVDNKALLNLGDDFILFAMIDIDGDTEEEFIIGNKRTRRVWIVGSGRTKE